MLKFSLHLQILTKATVTEESTLCQNHISLSKSHMVSGISGQILCITCIYMHECVLDGKVYWFSLLPSQGRLCRAYTWGFHYNDYCILPHTGHIVGNKAL